MGMLWTYVVSVCSDNGPDACGVRQLLAARQPHLFNVPCVSHGLSLVVKSVFGPARERKGPRPFTDVYDFANKLHAYIFGRGSTNQRRARLSSRLGSSFVTKIDFVPTRWGTALLALGAIQNNLDNLISFFEDESQRGGNNTAACGILTQLRTYGLVCSMEILLNIFEHMVDCVKLSQLSGGAGDGSDSTSNLEKLVSSLGFLRDDLQRSDDSENKYVERITRSIPVTQRDGIVAMLLQKLRDGKEVAMEKMERRVLPTLEALRFKVLLDPVLLVKVARSGVLRQWYETAGGPRTSLPEPHSFPDLLIDPALDRLHQLKLISKQAKDSFFKEWERFYHSAEAFVDEYSSNRPTKKQRFGEALMNGAAGSSSSSAPDDSGQGAPTSAEFWMNVSEEGFTHVRKLAEYVALIVVTNADVERRFNVMQRILPSCRSGRIGDELLAAEFFLRGNEDFFSKTGIKYWT